jgi:hypothetical protein
VTVRHRWEDNIKMDLQEAGGVGRGDWMELAQDRDRWWALVGTVRDFRVNNIINNIFINCNWVVIL